MLLYLLEATPEIWNFHFYIGMKTKQNETIFHVALRLVALPGEDKTSGTGTQPKQCHSAIKGDAVAPVSGQKGFLSSHHTAYSGESKLSLLERQMLHGPCQMY